MNAARELKTIRRDWQDCRRCPLGQNAFRHVLYEILTEGETRADVLFIGEAPGRAEDSIGKPFCGPSGNFLRRTIAAARPDGLVLALSNLLACRPTNDYGKDRQPMRHEVRACRGRLIQLIHALDPYMIVGLGRIPEDYIPGILKNTDWVGDTEYLRHPAYLIRQGGEKSANYVNYRVSFEDVFRRVRVMKERIDRHAR